MVKLYNSILYNSSIDNFNELIKDIDNNDVCNLIIFLLENSNKMIFDDDTFFSYLIILIKNKKFSLATINFTLIKNLDKNIFEKCSKILILKSNYDILEKKISYKLELIKKSLKKIFKDLDDKNIIFKLNMYAISFYDKKFITSLQISDQIMNANKMASLHWENVNTTEIENRLIQLKTIFDTNFLKSLNIKIISKQEFNELNFLNKILYYSDCTLKLFNFATGLKDNYILFEHIKTLLSQVIENINSESDELLEDSIDCSYASESSEEYIIADSITEYDNKFVKDIDIPTTSSTVDKLLDEFFIIDK